MAATAHRFSASSSDASSEVTFCAVQRVAGQLFVCVATTAPNGWSVHRVGRFGAAPVQLAVDSAKDGGLIANVRFFRLFQLPRAARKESAQAQQPGANGDIGALFVSERCKEVDYQRNRSAFDGLEEQRHVEDEDEAAMLDIDDGDARENLTVFSMSDERVLKKLPPSPSLVLDVQFNATTAAVLCESNEILLYDLTTFALVRTIGTSAPAMSLGPRWIAYPGFVPDRDRESMDGSLASDSEEVVPEALVGSHHHVGSKLESSSYSAIDVAQNVASGLYYLSEIGRATIAPYIVASSPSASVSTASNSATPVGSYGYPSSSPYGSAPDASGRSLAAATAKRHAASLGVSSAHGGWVVVQDVVTERVICNFKCHSTALVTLAFDFSGLLLATGSSKGQNLHVYRLLPPLQATHGKKRDGHQLLYKLQRGITHASIQDVAFSQDSKWVNVTSAHGTSHLYAIHPEGARINAETHANAAESPVRRASSDSALARDVDDFYAEFRALETKTLAQVLKIRHAAPSGGSSVSATPAATLASPPLGRGSYLVESALDASQAFFSHLAHSTSLSMDFGYHTGDDNDVEARRKRRRRRISCLFAHDDAKMLICCDRALKLFDMKVQPSASASEGHTPVVTVDSSRTKSSSSSASAFGFDASVTELKLWELLAGQARAKTSDPVADSGSLPSECGWIRSKANGKSELRTFAPRTLPLWAHPKVTFRASDRDCPDGRVLEVKRKGPNQEASGAGAAAGDDQMFVLEMDSYFGIGGSPVFNGQTECRVAPEVPPLDLRQSINMAMSTSLASPAPNLSSSSSSSFPEASVAVAAAAATSSSKKKKKKSGRGGSAAAVVVADTEALGAALHATTSDDAHWIAAAQQWVAWDMNAGTRAAVQALLDAGDVAQLRALFDGRLEFGTAGLRAAMGPGTKMMNDLVVVQTTQGICKYLTREFGERSKSMGFAIGYDHRAKDSLSSKRFAELAAAVCVAHGIRVYLYEGFVATPLVPFCIEQKGCAGGVMVTASHNPKADNGYKVYWANGSQIIPPHDEGIAASILENLAPWHAYDDRALTALRSSPLVADPTAELTESYFATMQARLCRYPADNTSTDFKIAYTAMHGVGHAFTSRSFAAFGHQPYIPTPAQLLPDPEFPTVAFPNPEEGKGALKLAMEAAEAHGARLILANDPDADRLAVAEQDPATKTWTIFTGNDIGLLLGHWELTQYMKQHPDADRTQLYFVASTVSSKMLRAVAHAEGLNFVETLTGFKWMGNKTAELRGAGKVVLFSFEEAIGFCVGDLVKDKDGVVAAAVFAELAVQLAKTQTTVKQHLDALYAKYGHYVTQNHYVKCYDPATTDAIFARLRNGGQYWPACGDFAIAHVRDLTTGYDSAQPDQRAVLPVSASSHMITYTFANGCVATLRTSGTEPKLKYYVELAGQVGQSRAEVAAILRTQVHQLVELMLQPTENNLERPPADA
ncbi:hypothetical protein PybrP1_009500 [[Pythium] brassicae (nom. inval.)]|nr:hypothetical protein PybrP1_009500 [[Pythium] brassicae (nom. inval.)]